jgi:hypothetical protein
MPLHFRLDSLRRLQMARIESPSVPSFETLPLDPSVEMTAGTTWVAGARDLRIEGNYNPGLGRDGYPKP